MPKLFVIGFVSWSLVSSLFNKKNTEDLGANYYNLGKRILVELCVVHE